MGHHHSLRRKMAQVEEKKGNPKYTGMRKYVSKGGYALWYPREWRQIPMTGGHEGIILAPYPDHINTCIAAEKIMLPFKVTPEDFSVLRKGFKDGLNALPGVEIELQDESVIKNLILFDARYTFLEDGERRKRWTRNVYWGEGQLILLAQGQTVQDFDYWMPMFFNTLMTAEVGSPA
jgi:hypothetical protein